MGPARLPGHRLAFHKAGSDGSAKCDIPECPRSEVLGVVYEISADDLAVLDRIEGVGAGYCRERLDVQLGDRQQAVHAYIATWIDPDLRPFSWYRDHVLIGAASIGLPESYLSRIRAVAAMRDPDLERERRERSIYRSDEYKKI